MVIYSYFIFFGYLIVGVGFDNKGLFIYDLYGEWFFIKYWIDLSGVCLYCFYELICNVCMLDGNFWVYFILK